MELLPQYLMSWTFNDRSKGKHMLKPLGAINKIYLLRIVNSGSLILRCVILGFMGVERS